MSVPAGKAGSAAGDDKPNEESACRPLTTHASPLAQAVRHVHPAVLAASFYAGFGALVRDPVATMAVSLPAVVVLQVAYAVLCLPAAGSPAKGTKKPRPGEKRKPGADAAGPSLLSVSRSPFPPGSRAEPTDRSRAHRPSSSRLVSPSSPHSVSTPSSSCSARRCSLTSRKPSSAHCTCRCWGFSHCSTRTASQPATG